MGQLFREVLRAAIPLLIQRVTVPVSILHYTAWCHRIDLAAVEYVSNLGIALVKTAPLLIIARGISGECDVVLCHDVSDQRGEGENEKGIPHHSDILLFLGAIRAIEPNEHIRFA